MSLGRNFAKKIRREITGLHANFPPSRTLELGDYGRIEDDVFQRQGNVRQLGINFGVVPGGSPTNFEFSSDDAVEIEFILKGEVRPGGVPAARAGLEIRFSREEAFFFSAAGCVIDQIENQVAVGQELVRRLREGEWEADYYVVTNLVRSKSTTLVASASKNSEIKLEAKSDAIQEIDLADASIGLRRKSKRNTSFEMITESGHMPLMQLSRLRGIRRDEFRVSAVAMESTGSTLPFSFGPEGAVAQALPSPVAAEFEGAEPARLSAIGGLDSDFSFRAVASAFERERAMTAYIPLLRACYQLANNEPFVLPDGYESIGQIRVSASAIMQMEAVPLPPAAQSAVSNDMHAAAAIANPSAFGFVVREVATGSVLVCIRGTQTPREWLANFTAVPNQFDLVKDFGLVHLGFERMHRSVRQSIQVGLASVDAATRITVLGHSLGGAMAVLAAIDIKRNFGKTNVDVCTFGSPRVGKIGFRKNFNKEIRQCFRLVNQFDVVPRVPSVITGWNHTGEEIEVDGNVENPHSLDAYLAGLRNLGQHRETAIPGVMTDDFAGAVASAIATGGEPVVLSMRVP
jgi:triacylglycerol lipase